MSSDTRFLVNKNLGTVFASAARTTTATSGAMSNPSATKLVIYIEVTAVTATPGLTVAILGKNPVTGTYLEVARATAFAPTGADTLTLIFGNLAARAVANKTEQIASAIPVDFKIQVIAADADSCTYSVGAHLLQ